MRAQINNAMDEREHMVGEKSEKSSEKE